MHHGTCEVCATNARTMRCCATLRIAQHCRTSIAAKTVVIEYEAIAVEKSRYRRESLMGRPLRVRSQGGVFTTTYRRGTEVWFFHEKAAPVNLDTVFGRSSRNADRRPTGGAKLLACLPQLLIVESPRFHPHSWWSCLPRCQLVSSIANGCCHLGTELNYLCLQKVYVPNRTRSHPNSTICHQPYL